VSAVTARAPASGAASSFRDPGGRVLRVGNRLIRLLKQEAAAELRDFLGTACARQFTSAGRLVPSDFLSTDVIHDLRAIPEFGAVCEQLSPCTAVEHQPIAFPAFPYEWSPAMLYAAAELTLDLAEGALAEGFGLKDATPYNVLFRGPQPVFVDVLSFERRDPLDATWLPHSQFLRGFILPLLVNKQLGVPLDQVFITQRDGPEPDAVSRMCGPLRKWLPPFLTLASLPAWLGRRHRDDDLSIYQRRPAKNPELARFTLGSLFRHLRRLLARVAPRPGATSVWSDYMADEGGYSRESFEAKRGFVEAALAECRPQAVLDIGCNTGFFSRMAAQAGARVVAMDSDPVALDRLWRVAHAEHLDIVPLVVDLARPTPGIGWRNQECASFLDRARRSFDAVLLLAVVHHLLVSERVPLADILALAAELTTGIVVIEFVGPQDPMFRRIARGRDHLFTDLDVSSFEAACRKGFEVVRGLGLPGSGRRLYLLRKRQP